ncbi:MAG: aldose 1-epimerase [Thermoprotei archaeon]
MSKKVVFGSHGAVVLEKNGNKITTVNYGALLNQFSFQGFEFIESHASPEALISGPTRAGCAVLMPFANRISGGKYSFNGKSYFLPINERGRDNAIHGLLTDKVWDVICLYGDEAPEESVGEQRKVIYGYDFPGIGGYPFLFHAEVEYALGDSGLHVGLSVTNTGNTPLPLSMGTHPYYKVDGRLKDWVIDFDSLGRFLTKDMIPTGEIVRENPSGKIGDRSFDGCYALNGDLRLYNKRGLLIKMTGFPYVQLYTPPSRTSIAIEPMTGIPDAFNNGIGLKKLAPGEKFQASYDVIPFEI